MDPVACLVTPTRSSAGQIGVRFSWSITAPPRSESSVAGSTADAGVSKPAESTTLTMGEGCVVRDSQAAGMVLARSRF